MQKLPLGNKLPSIGVDIHIILVQPHTPQNAGSIGRTCLGYNATLHLVGPLGFSLEEKYVRRSGLDYWNRVTKKIWNNYEEFKEYKAKELTHKYYFSTKANHSLLDHNFGKDLMNNNNDNDSIENNKKSIGLFFGCESKGLYELLGEKEMNDGKVLTIPMNENPEASFRSYNLSCTVSMVVWDLYKYCYMSTKKE